MSNHKSILQVISILSSILIIIIALSSYISYQFYYITDELTRTNLPIKKYTENILSEYADIKFRMAANLADILPSAGNIRKLIKSRKSILSNVREIKNLVKRKNIYKAKFNTIYQNVIKSYQGLNHLLVAYETDHTEFIEDYIQDEWPKIHSDIILSLHSFSSLREDDIEYQTKYLQRIVLIFHIACFLILPIAMIMVLYIYKRSKDLLAELDSEKKEIKTYKEALDQVAITSITDNKGIIKDINHNFELVSGYSKNEVLGKTHTILNSDYHTKDFFKKMTDVIQSGNIWRNEICNKKKTGEVYWVDTAIIPIWDNKKKIYDFMYISFDITKRKENEKIIENQKSQMIEQSKLSAIGEMAGGIAHELNTPLGLISLSIGEIDNLLCKDGHKKEAVKDLVEDINKAVNRMSKIITSMRKIFRKESHGNFSIVDIQEIVEESILISNYRLKNSNIDLTVNKLGSDLTLQCRPTELSQLFINLINNAKDAIEILNEKWIRIDLIKKNSFIEIIFEDSGPGISEEIANKMFNPFFTTKEIGKGTGLGLGLVLGIVQNHKGSILYDKNSAHTKFVIKIPVFQEIN